MAITPVTPGSFMTPAYKAELLGRWAVDFLLLLGNLNRLYIGGTFPPPGVTGLQMIARNTLNQWYTNNIGKLGILPFPISTLNLQASFSFNLKQTNVELRKAWLDNFLRLRTQLPGTLNGIGINPAISATAIKELDNIFKNVLSINPVFKNPTGR
jgi:hypothetical protein